MRLTSDAASPWSYCSRKTSPLHSPFRFGVLDNSVDRWNRQNHMKYSQQMLRLSSRKCSSAAMGSAASSAHLSAFDLVDYSQRQDSVSSILALGCVRKFDGNDGCCLEKRNFVSGNRKRFEVFNTQLISSIRDFLSYQ